MPVPQYHPSPRELDDLELLVSGALGPSARFGEPGSPVTLTLPSELGDAEVVELVDPEGLPLARVSADGSVEALTHAQFGPFRRLYLTPAEVRGQHGGATFVPVTDALDEDQLARLAAVDGPVVLVALVGHGTPDLTPVGLLRATLAAARRLIDAAVVAVPLAAHGDADVDHDLGVRVLGAYAGDDPVLGLPEEESEAPLSDEIAAIVDFDQPAPGEQGVVLFFTGLSGSGKSTVARAVMDHLLEEGGRTITSLDGDVVRRTLSAGLTFSREDRETNIRRIGWVAAEVTRHGGVAVCSPIAPFDETRQQVRQMVEDAGGEFVLVHVATPLAECERRDRKGLYARARAGEVLHFTGIDDPYEAPLQPEIVIDAAVEPAAEAAARIVAHLTRP
ncbi:MAG: adenylyl-sulfate kinase, partial [Nocardioides sp.]